MKSTLVYNSSRVKLIRFISCFSVSRRTKGYDLIEFGFGQIPGNYGVNRSSLEAASTQTLQSIVLMLIEECTEEGRSTQEIMGIGGMLMRIGMVYRDGVDCLPLTTFNQARFLFTEACSVEIVVGDQV